MVAVVCVVFVCRAPGRLQNGPSDSLDVLWCSRGPCVVLIFLLDTLPVSLKFSTHNRMDFRSGTRYRVGDLVASTERTLHRYDRVTLRKVGFDDKWTLLVGPHHLYYCGVL